jgi:hypothetical protein
MLGEHPALGYLNEPRQIWRHQAVTDIWSEHAERRGGRLHLTAADVVPRHISRIVRDFAAEVHLLGAARLVEKLPANSFRVEFLDAVFPDALFLHLVRNGTDVAAFIERRAASGNWFGHGDYKWRQIEAYAVATGEGDLLQYCTDNFLRGLLEWRLAVLAARSSLQKLPPSRWVEVRYEDFVAEPFEICRQLETFIAIPPNELMRGFAAHKVIRPSIPSNPLGRKEELDLIGGLLLRESHPIDSQRPLGGRRNLH